MSGAAPEACFTHRHLREDTQRQKLVLAKLAAAYALDGRGPLETIVSVMRLAAERYMAGGAEELAPELCSLVVACARPPMRQPMVDEAANRRARGELLSTLSRVASSAPAKLRAAIDQLALANGDLRDGEVRRGAKRKRVDEVCLFVNASCHSHDTTCRFTTRPRRPSTT
jgi:hypothetical protein